ncbi:hypothetical protein Ndes2437B_g04166 [Nannochloris sp. 'desiccata']
MRRAGFSKKVLKQYQEAFLQHSTGRYPSEIVGQAAKDSALGTFAQLQAEARAGVLKLREAHMCLQTEFQEMRESIPLLVRSIWGAHATALMTTMRQRQANVSRLIIQWQDAEHRLIAVANSLTHLQTGQKLIAVGAPLAAAHLLGSPSTAHCYQTTARNAASHTLAEGSLTLNQLNALVSRLAEEITLVQRGVFLFFLFIPVLVTAPVLLLTDRHRDNWLRLMIWTIEHAGPAFIKWGQWAATRPDLFAPDVCSALGALQTDAPSHTFKHTRSTVETSFKLPLEQIFATFEEQPVASGSIAQVHRAVLTPLGAQLAQHDANNLNGPKLLGGLIPLPRRASSRREAITFSDGATVAVKVRHPKVTDLMEQDFKLMKRAASIVGALPGGSGPQLKESLMQFGAPMREQLDLRSEAEHLSRFAENFKWWSGVRFPLPAAPSLVASDVLVESFEEGEHISKYLNTEYAHNKRLAYLGMSCYLKMLLRDNYIHADLHPGNILVSMESPTSSRRAATKASSVSSFSKNGGDGSNSDVAVSGSSEKEEGSILSKLSSALGWHLNFDFTLPRLVLLDVGMTARLTNDDQRNLVGFFSSLAAMDGGGLADSILKFSEKDAVNPSGFKNDMTELFDALEPDYMRENSQEVIGWIMDTIRKHQVHLKGVVSTVVFSSMVLEGWSTKLNPDIRIVETLKEILPSEWRTRAQHAVDKVVENQMMITTMA